MFTLALLVIVFISPFVAMLVSDVMERRSTEHAEFLEQGRIREARRQARLAREHGI